MITYINHLRDIPPVVDRVGRGEKLQCICGEDIYRRCLLSALQSVFRTDAGYEERGNVLEVFRCSVHGSSSSEN